MSDRPSPAQQASESGTTAPSGTSANQDARTRSDLDRVKRMCRAVQDMALPRGPRESQLVQAVICTAQVACEAAIVSIEAWERGDIANSTGSWESLHVPRQKDLSTTSSPTTNLSTSAKPQRVESNARTRTPGQLASSEEPVATTVLDAQRQLRRRDPGAYEAQCSHQSSSQ
jgi:hypothetical protein